MKETALKLKGIVRRLIVVIRKYPMSSFFFLLIWYLSFFTPPKTELDDVAFIDKWVHIAMYGGTCGTLWIEYIMRHKSGLDKAKLAIWAWLMPIVMSGVIELLQEYCTNGRRSGDWLDLAANATGVTLAAVFGFLLHRFFFSTDLHREN